MKNIFTYFLLLLFAGQALISCKAPKYSRFNFGHTDYGVIKKEMKENPAAINQEINSVTEIKKPTIELVATENKAPADITIAKKKPVDNPMVDEKIQHLKTIIDRDNSLAPKSKLTFKEKRELIKAIKNTERASNQRVLEVVLAFLIPPLAVYLHEREIGTKFWVSLLLTLIFWIPGIIFALLVVTDTI